MTDRPDLRAELLRRADRDQAARRDRDVEAIGRADEENLPWLKDVLAEVGWPRRRAVGEDGAHAAWLLAQHADRDPAFQRRCLDLVTVAAEQGEASRTEIAYLTDRVLLAEGQPQEFGTQVVARAGEWVPSRLREPGGVDERRATVSLGPMAGYLARIAEHYGPPVSPSVPCPRCGEPIEFEVPDTDEQTPAECAHCGQTLTIG